MIAILENVKTKSGGKTKHALYKMIGVSVNCFLCLNSGCFLLRRKYLSRIQDVVRVKKVFYLLHH